jgi:DNA-binding NarL/FixJ family response regulator
MGRARIILADDHPELLECVAGMLNSEFDVVEMVENGQALVEAAERLSPDVLISDITMPVMDGLEAARQLRLAGSTAKVVFLTIHQDEDFVKTALEAGAQGYVVKCRLAFDLIEAAREVLAGRQFISKLR